MTGPTESATGSVGLSSWRVPTSRGSLLLEVEPAAFGRRVTVRLGGREIARLTKPNGQAPWAEHVLASDEHMVLLALVWEPSAVSSHLFVDGLNLRDGVGLDLWRARAPKPIDRFEQNVIHGSVLKQNNFHPEWGLLGGVGVIVATLRDQPLPVVILAVVTVSIVTMVCGYGWLWVVKRFALWLATKRKWNDGLRAEAYFLFLISPGVALLVALSLATAH